MSFVGFGDNGYDYFNKNNYILFSADNTHNYLFDYVDSDLSCLPKLFKQYIFKRINTTTLEPKNYNNEDEDLKNMEKILTSAHPYYKYEHKKTIINAIGNYFNKLLIYSVFHEKSFTPECVLEEKWYYPKFHCLIPSSLADAGNYPDGFFPIDFRRKLKAWVDSKYKVCFYFHHKYKEWVDDMGYREGEIEESFIMNVPSEMPVGFSEELQTQKIIRNLLYYILNVSATGMENLTTSQRIWLYGNIFYNQKELSEIRATRKLLFRPPALYSEKDRVENPYFPYLNEQLKNDDEMNDMFRPFYVLGELNVADNGIPADIVESFNSVIEYAKTINTPKTYEEYEINNLRELLSLEIMAMAQSGTVIKKCENCDKYFVRNDKKKKYCDRIDESGITCYKAAKKKQFQKKLENDPAFKLYNTAYKRHHAQFKKGNMTQKEFLLWQEQAQTKRTQVTNGELDISTFKEWLKKR